MRLRSLVLVVCLAGEQAPGAARVWEGEPHTTNGTVVLGAPPAAIFEAATAYADWKELFSDVRWVRVEPRSQGDAIVRFASRSLGRTMTIAFHNQDNRAVRFSLVKGPPGARARGEYLLEPLGHGRTIVYATFYMRATGIGRLFIGDRQVRAMRQRKLRADLEDLAKRFP